MGGGKRCRKTCKKGPETTPEPKEEKQPETVAMQYAVLPECRARSAPYPEAAVDVKQEDKIEDNGGHNWSEYETELLIEGLRRFGRNFQKIREIAFPHMNMQEIIGYYYGWKWTSTLELPIKRVDKRVYKRREVSLTRPSSRPSRTITRSVMRGMKGDDAAEEKLLSIEERVLKKYHGIPHTDGSPPRKAGRIRQVKRVPVEEFEAEKS